MRPAPYDACIAYDCIPENIEFWDWIDCEIHEDGKTIDAQSTVSSYQKRVGHLMPHQGEKMDENNTPQPPKTNIKKTPISIASFGPLSAVIFRREIEKNANKKTDVVVSIRRNVTEEGDDPTLVPLAELPALAMLLQNIAEPGMTLQQIAPAPTATPPAPAAPNRAARRKGKKK